MQSYRNSTTLLSTVALLIISYSFFISYQLQQISFSLPLSVSLLQDQTFMDAFLICPLPPFTTAAATSVDGLSFIFIYFSSFFGSQFSFFSSTPGLSLAPLFFFSPSSHYGRTYSLSLFFSYITWSVFSNRKKKKINWNQLKINGHFKITTWSMLFSDRKRPAYKGQFHKLELHYHIKPATQITWICIYKF